MGTSHAHAREREFACWGVGGGGGWRLNEDQCYSIFLDTFYQSLSELHNEEEIADRDPHP